MRHGDDVVAGIDEVDVAGDAGRQIRKKVERSAADLVERDTAAQRRMALLEAEHRARVIGYIEKGVAEGARLLVDGRERTGGNEGGYFLGPTVFDGVAPGMTIAREEIFGPVLSVMRVKDLDAAIALVNGSAFGNTTSIFTADGRSAREYASRVEVGMVGVNVGVAAPMAFFPFSGWKNSFYGDLHAHGRDAVAFYTEQKVIMSRWF